MYALDEIRSIHLEVTSKCQAKCPMCPRRIQGGPLLDTLYLEEIDLETFVNWFPKDFVRQLDDLNMCGNLGDPIIAKDTLEIYRYLRETNPSMHLQMHTNGSARSFSWWKELASLNVRVVFGIDGLADTHALYRVNTDFLKIIQNAKAFISAGGDARWDMLVFKHNEHQVHDCETMSKNLGFTHFYTKHTSRFRDGKLDVIDDNYNVTHTLYPTTHSDKNSEGVEKAKQDVLPNISCKAQTNNQIYVTANGGVSACCWLDLEWVPQHSFSRIDYMSKVKEYPNLNNKSLSEIFASGFFSKISSCWTTTGLKECTRQCGNFDKLNKQFVEVKQQ
jgi:MoaA/NifB/PqqE/SkfB family radical SAM enzyme